jgi:hypothetical protein
VLWVVPDQLALRVQLEPRVLPELLVRQVLLVQLDLLELQV